jgi:hypothetical protein
MYTVKKDLKYVFCTADLFKDPKLNYKFDEPFKIGNGPSPPTVISPCLKLTIGQIKPKIYQPDLKIPIGTLIWIVFMHILLMFTTHRLTLVNINKNWKNHQFLPMFLMHEKINQQFIGNSKKKRT